MYKYVWMYKSTNEQRAAAHFFPFSISSTSYFSSEDNIFQWPMHELINLAKLASKPKGSF